MARIMARKVVRRMTVKREPMSPPPGGVGDDYYHSFLGALSNLSSEFSRKLDTAEADTRSQFRSFSSDIAGQFQTITNKFESAMADRDRKFEAFSTKVLEGRQAPWALLLTAISVAVLIMGAIGGLAYAPIAQRTSSMERSIEKVADLMIASRDVYVTQKDLDARSQRGAEDRDRTNRAIENLQAQVFTRDVHVQHWNNIDAAIAAANARIDVARQDLQRQIDALQRSLGDQYTTRDALFDNKARLSKLEDLIRQLSASKSMVSP